ncbi:MAG: hypothetical protein ACF8Q5_01495 [Phycisphaerales bacterium JB040]
MRTLGWFLAILGSLAAGAAVLMAVREIGALYTGTLEDPMGDSPEGKAVAADILTYVALAVPGMLLSLLGFILIVRSRLKRSRARALHAADARNDPDNVMNRLTPHTPNRIRVPGKDSGAEPAPPPHTQSRRTRY